MNLDPIPGPLHEAPPPHRPAYEWAVPVVCGVLMAALGFGSVAVFGFTVWRLTFGLAGAAVCIRWWPR